MADQASTPTDVAGEAGDAVATAEAPDLTIEGQSDAPGADALTTAVPDGGDGDLLNELARAMHVAATSQYQRLNADLERRRGELAEAIAARASAETENLKAESQADIGAVDAWAKAEAEKVKLERLRRIDARREQLAAQLERQETIREREVAAIEVAIDAYRNDVDLFFGRMERETDPSEIARVAASMPPFPSLADVAEQARRGASAEFASLEGDVDASTAETTPTVMTTAEIADTTEPAADGASTLDAAANADTEADTEGAPDADLEPATAVSESRLMAVMDPGASRAKGDTMPRWEAPYAVSVAAGTGPAEVEPAPMSVGSTLLRTVRSIRPMAGRHDKDSGEGGASR